VRRRWAGRSTNQTPDGGRSPCCQKSFCRSLMHLPFKNLFWVRRTRPPGLPPRLPEPTLTDPKTARRETASCLSPCLCRTWKTSARPDVFSRVRAAALFLGKSFPRNRSLPNIGGPSTEPYPAPDIHAFESSSRHGRTHCHSAAHLQKVAAQSILNYVVVRLGTTITRD